ncbi:DUF945 family protein [Vibrio fujianensis]|uniref:DUF945 family protein n=1 Tax=Vibrio fujianensis TaxID=1974215 RepID=UPI000C1645E5|nr:DUF945 family protein [Vibrio fujianensis]
MKTLKRIGAVGGAVALILCWPLAVGQVGQKIVTDGLANLSNDQVKTELVSYERGYFSSSAVTRYTVLDRDIKRQLEQQGLPSEWVINSDIQHHAFSLSAVSTFSEQTHIPLQLNTQTRLNGSTDFQMHLDNWFYQSKGEQPFTLSMTASSLQGTASILGEISYALTLPSIALNFTNGEQVQLAHVYGEGKGKQEKGFWVGQHKITLGEMTIRDVRQATRFNLNHAMYEFRSSMDASKQRFTGQHMVTVRALKTGDDEIRDAIFDFTLGDVDRKAFTQLSELYQGGRTLSNSLINQARPAIEKLFSQGFSLTLNRLALTIGQGELEAKWQLTVPEGTHDVLHDPGALFSVLSGFLEALVSQSLVKDYPFIQQGVDQLVLMEMATHNEQGYQLKVDIHNGLLVFASGKQVPLTALMMPLLLQ